MKTQTGNKRLTPDQRARRREIAAELGGTFCYIATPDSCSSHFEMPDGPVHLVEDEIRRRLEEDDG